MTLKKKVIESQLKMLKNKHRFYYLLMVLTIITMLFYNRWTVFAVTVFCAIRIYQIRQKRESLEEAL